MISEELRRAAVRRILAGEISYRKLAAELNLSPTTIWKWVQNWHRHSSVSPRPRAYQDHSRGKHVPAELKARLTSHLLRGEISYSEAALLAGVHPSTAYFWLPKDLKIRKARDEYLRRLFPDILGPPRNPAPTRENQALSGLNMDQQT